MNIWIFNLGLIAVMVLVLGVFAIIQFKKQMEIRKKLSGYPKGYWMSKGIGIGVAIGVGMGIAMNNIPVGVGAGVAIGAAIGSRLEKKHKDEIRPMTDEEKKLKKQSILLVFGTLLIGILVFIITYFFAK